MDLAEQFDRISLPYNNDSKRYKLYKSDYDNFHKRQFIFMYQARIGLLESRIVQNARKILGDESISITEIDCCPPNQKVLILGSIFKKMKFRQSVLYEFADDSNLLMKMTKENKENICDKEDVLELEDSRQIIKLTDCINKHHFVTGDVIGVYGYQEMGTDLFNVARVIVPELPEQIEWPLVKMDSYVAFISGISLTSDLGKNARTFMALDAFQKWINTELVPDAKECAIVRDVVRLVIAGDSIRLNPVALEDRKVAAIGVGDEPDIKGISFFDIFLKRILHNLPVDLMPGANDPAQCTIPQQPIPSVVFQASRNNEQMLNTVTNPYRFSLDGVQLLGTSGQNINNLARLTQYQNPLERMERTLRMGCLFPSVPDTVAGFPFKDRDPLVLDKLPHVYFAGNQPAFARNMVEFEEGGTAKKRCLLLALPKFCDTFEVVLLNLRNMDTQLYSFDVDPNFELTDLQF